MDVSEDRGTPKSSISIGFSIIFTIHLFLETPKSLFLDETTKNLLPSLIDSRYRDAVSLRCGSWTLKKSMWRRLPPQMAIVCGCCLGGDSWQKGGRRWGGNHCKTMIISIISLGATHFVCSSELPTCFFFPEAIRVWGLQSPLREVAWLFWYNSIWWPGGNSCASWKSSKLETSRLYQQMMTYIHIYI